MNYEGKLLPNCSVHLTDRPVNIYRSGSFKIACEVTKRSIWLSFASPGLPAEEDITIREDAPQRYEFAAMLCCLLFANRFQLFDRTGFAPGTIAAVIDEFR